MFLNISALLDERIPFLSTASTAISGTLSPVPAATALNLARVMLSSKLDCHSSLP